MILYHGSNIVIEKIDLDKSRPNKDFGRGFYLTKIKEQSIQMAKRTFKRFGAEQWVTVFDFDETIMEKAAISVKQFQNPNEEWVDFVLNNRSPKRKCEPMQNNRDNKYEIVYGPVANDDIDLSFNLFEQGFINKQILLDRLVHKKLNNQYSFHSIRALQFLYRKEAFHV